MNLLIERLKANKAVIGIVGLGYVGLPLALRFAEEGFPVLGFDIDEFKVNRIKEGASYIEHIPSQAVKAAVSKGFNATTSFKEITNVDAIILCVPTPLNKYHEPSKLNRMGQ